MENFKQRKIDCSALRVNALYLKLKIDHVKEIKVKFYLFSNVSVITLYAIYIFLKVKFHHLL